MLVILPLNESGATDWIIMVAMVMKAVWDIPIAKVPIIANGRFVAMAKAIFPTELVKAEIKNN